MKVWILQTGEPLHCDNDNARPMRAMNLANALVNAGHHVTLWSSAFYHQKKQHRTKEFKKIIINEQLEILLLPSPGYEKNIGLARLWDHLILAINLKKQLKDQTLLPDVAFIGYPPIETAFVLSNYLAKKKIPTILDIKDQWPTIFVDALPKKARFIGSILFYPYFFMAKKTMKESSGISTMAQGFLEWATEFSKRKMNPFDIISPLTAASDGYSHEQLQQAHQWWHEKKSLNISDSSIFRIIFIGTLSPAFDFQTIAEAAKQLLQDNEKIQIIICGDGSEKENIENIFKDAKNIYLAGWIDRTKINVLASYSHAFIAPYKNTDNFIRNIPNKILDALSLGLPILTPLSGEVEKLVKNNNIGLYYDNAHSLAHSIKYLISNHNVNKKISSNAKQLYNDQFSYEKVYGDLVKHLENIVSTNEAKF